MGYDVPMSTLLRISFYGALAVAVAFLVLSPTKLRRFGGRVRTIGYAYVAAVLISAALRLLWS